MRKSRSRISSANNPGGGWKYQAPGQGNNGAEGAHYYYKSQTRRARTSPRRTRPLQLQGQHPGRRQVPDPAARRPRHQQARRRPQRHLDQGRRRHPERDAEGHPDAHLGRRRVREVQGRRRPTGSTPTSSPPASTATRTPKSVVVFDKGVHTITFAPRSTGFHINSVLVVKKGSTGSGPDTNPEAGPEAPAAGPATDIMSEPLPQAKPDPKPDSKPDPAVDADTVKVAVAAGDDDLESKRPRASDDLEFGEDEQSVGLRFDEVELKADAEIKSAYFVFKAAEDSKRRGEVHHRGGGQRQRQVLLQGRRAGRPRLRRRGGDWNAEALEEGQDLQVRRHRRADREGDRGRRPRHAGLPHQGLGRAGGGSLRGDGQAPELVINYDHA